MTIGYETLFLFFSYYWSYCIDPVNEIRHDLWPLRFEFMIEVRRRANYLLFSVYEEFCSSAGRICCYLEPQWSVTSLFRKKKGTTWRRGDEVNNIQLCFIIFFSYVILFSNLIVGFFSNGTCSLDISHSMEVYWFASSKRLLSWPFSDSNDFLFCFFVSSRYTGVGILMEFMR